MTQIHLVHREIGETKFVSANLSAVIIQQGTNLLRIGNIEAHVLREMLNTMAEERYLIKRLNDTNQLKLPFAN